MMISAVSGASYALESLEPTFHQDLNGDGLIGPPTRVIQVDGSDHLTEVGNHFFLYDSIGSGPSLKYAHADVVAGEFGAWAPIGALQTASGYEVAWKVTGADQYTVLKTDSSRNYITIFPYTTLFRSYALESLETTFHQDLNGDGLIGPPTRMIQVDGSDRKAAGRERVFISDGNGSVAKIKDAHPAAVTGELRASAPINTLQRTRG